MSLSEDKPDLTKEDLNLICRVCLSTSGVLKNMFDWGLNTDFYKLTNITIHSEDTISKSLCLSCEDMLLKCLKFKRQCEDSDLLLRDTEKKKLTLQHDAKSARGETEKNVIKFIAEDNKLTYIITAPNHDEKITFPCPYSSHGSFLKKKDLVNHLIKTHGKDNEYDVDIKFYCSYKDCSYHTESGTRKYFLKRKMLNQHYNKVHRDKIICRECNLKFVTRHEYDRHLKACNVTHWCQLCDKKYSTDERLMVHLMRVHPDFHKHYKREKAEKRKSESLLKAKKTKLDDKSDDVCNSPKRSFATQTLKNIKNDVSFSWQPENETKTDEISTQTVFEDLLSLKSQTSEDESIFCSETVSLSDIQTQTFPLEFGLIRSHKETLTSETQSPDLSIKETQTCVCLYDSQARPGQKILSNAHSSFPLNYISTETQTLEFDDLLRYNSAETQTSFNDLLSEGGL